MKRFEPFQSAARKRAVEAAEACAPALEAANETLASEIDLVLTDEQRASWERLHPRMAPAAPGPTE